jgi:ABC-type antimicrobial peptide transport system permease subunit
MFDILPVLRTALNTLRRNALLSCLSILLIVIGIAGVIAVDAVGEGASRSITKTMQSMGADNIMVFPGNTMMGGVSTGTGAAITMTPEDCDALNDPDRCPAIAAVAPVVRARSQVVSPNGKNWAPMYLYGTTPNFLDIRDWTNLAEGSNFSDLEVVQMKEVVLLGATVARELFGDGEPCVGEKVRINNRVLTVQGVLAKKGANMMGMDQDDIVLLPWRTLKFKVAGQSATVANASAVAGPTAAVATLSMPYPQAALPLYPPAASAQAGNANLVPRFTNIDQIWIKARGPNDVEAAMDQIKETLRETHHLAKGQPDDFTIRDMTEMGKALSSTTRLMKGMLLGVALVALVVGGVAIMAIMMVSVTLRTREIGLRMAVGARPRDILRQFLLEASLLCLIGGLLGIGVGWLGAFLMTQIMKWPTQVTPGAILLALGVSVTIGLVFGYYPAWKASRLDPIEALRYE